MKVIDVIIKNIYKLKNSEQIRIREIGFISRIRHKVAITLRKLEGKKLMCQLHKKGQNSKIPRKMRKIYAII